MRASLILLVLAAAPLPAAPAPAFTLKALDGSTYRLADHLGRRAVVVDFWATWCGPCTRALKQLQGVKERFPGVEVLAVSIDDGQSAAKVDPYVRGRGFTFTVLLDPEARACRLYNPKASVPYTVVIGKDGQVAYSHSGYLPGDERELAAKVEEALR
jgi:peroxiredoxin